MEDIMALWQSILSRCQKRNHESFQARYTVMVHRLPVDLNKPYSRCFTITFRILLVPGPPQSKAAELLLTEESWRLSSFIAMPFLDHNIGSRLDRKFLHGFRSLVPLSW